jgi:hypothetical protein
VLRPSSEPAHCICDTLSCACAHARRDALSRRCAGASTAISRFDQASSPCFSSARYVLCAWVLQVVRPSPRPCRPLQQPLVREHRAQHTCVC